MKKKKNYKFFIILLFSILLLFVGIFINSKLNNTTKVASYNISAGSLEEIHITEVTVDEKRETRNR